MRYYFYYIFFNAYWTSFDLGQIRIPRQNANYYMILTMIFLLSGLLLNLAGLGILQTNLTWPFLIGVGLILVAEQVLLSKNIVEKRLKSYEFIKAIPKKKRLSLFFGLLIFAGVFNISGAFIFAFYGN